MSSYGNWADCSWVGESGGKNKGSPRPARNGLSHEDYKNVRKDIAWEQIGVELKESGKWLCFIYWALKKSTEEKNESRPTSSVESLINYFQNKKKPDMDALDLLFSAHARTIKTFYYLFFWVFPRRLIVVCRCFGTLYRFHLQGLDVEYEKWAEDVVFIYQSWVLICTNVCTFIYEYNITYAVTLVTLFAPTCFDHTWSSSGSRACPC